MSRRLRLIWAAQTISWCVLASLFWSCPVVWIIVGIGSGVLFGCFVWLSAGRQGNGEQ